MPILDLDAVKQEPGSFDLENKRLKNIENNVAEMDDSLTNLQWLQEVKINISDVTKKKCVSYPSSPSSCFSGDEDEDSDCSSTDKPHIKLEPDEEIDYKTNPHVKPRYSYATLICMAMKEANTAKMTLSSIYRWITDNFVYYKYADQSWQNSIRHNLSLNKCFSKVPRKKGDPGKGGYWSLVVEHADKLLENQLRKRKASTDQNNNNIFPKRFRLDKLSRSSDKMMKQTKQRFLESGLNSTGYVEELYAIMNMGPHEDHTYGKEHPPTPEPLTPDPEIEAAIEGSAISVVNDTSPTTFTEALKDDICWNAGITGESLNESMRSVTQDLLDARTLYNHVNSPFMGSYRDMLRGYEMSSPFCLSPPPSADDVSGPVEFTDQFDLTVRGRSMPIHHQNIERVKVERLPPDQEWEDALDFLASNADLDQDNYSQLSTE